MSSVQQKLKDENTILIPHGSFNAYVGTDQMLDKLEVPLFGNRELLYWETDRDKQREWLLTVWVTFTKNF